jgi:hypothetical protein
MRTYLLAGAATLLLCACGGGGGGSASSDLPAVNSPGKTGSTGASPSAEPSASPKASASPGSGPSPNPSASASPKASSSPVASSSPSSSANPSPTPASTGPAHIPTWAFDDHFGEGVNASPATVQQYLSYAEGGYGDDKAQQDCDGSGVPLCWSVFYFDPNFIYASPVASCQSQISAEFLAAAAASENTQGDEWFVHEAGYTDAEHRVQGSYQQSCNGSTITTPVYLTNQLNSGVDAFFASYMQTYANDWDRFFMDDTSATVLTQAYGPGGGFCANDPTDNDWCLTTQEYPNDAAVVSAHEQLFEALSHVNGSAMEGAFNGVDFSGTENLNLFPASDGRLMAAVCEDCVVSAGDLIPTNYARVLNVMAAINAIPGASFVELSSGYSSAGSATQITQRLVTTAVAWLGFNGNGTIVFPNLEDNTNDLAIWPEDSIYPTQPLESMISGAADIAVPTNASVWRREFSMCYLGGSAIGPCAALLNADSSPVTISAAWLKQSYGHCVTMSGGDIESEGTVSITQTTFSANTTSIPASGAVLLVR